MKREFKSQTPDVLTFLVIKNYVLDTFFIQFHSQTLGNRCECHESSEMTIIKGRPVSQYVWYVKEPSLLNVYEWRVKVKICSPSPLMVTSPNEWKFLDTDENDILFFWNMDLIGTGRFDGLSPTGAPCVWVSGSPSLGPPLCTCVSTDFCRLVALTESSGDAICQSLLRHLLMALEVKGLGQSQMLLKLKICQSSGPSAAYPTVEGRV